MTKDVIELAREAGLIRKDRNPREASMVQIDSFAALVAARERERIAEMAQRTVWAGREFADRIRALNTEGDGHDATTAQKGGE